MSNVAQIYGGGCYNALIPSNICETVPATYWKAGLRVKFVDISRQDFLPDEKQILNNVRQDTTIKILHYNHTYGCATEKQEHLFELIKSEFPKIIIIDDKCLCPPELNLTANHYADMYLYSTGPVKVVDIGYGGFAHINSRMNYSEFALQYDEEAEIIFNAHIKKCHAEKCRVDMKIAMGNWLCTKYDFDAQNYFHEVKVMIDKVKEHKREINLIYDELKGKLPEQYNLWRFNLIVKNNEECLKALFDNGLFASKHYMSLGNGYFGEEKTPMADWLESHVINLFNDFRFNKEQAIKAVKIINQFTS